jgi:hypothetical protein
MLIYTHQKSKKKNKTKKEIAEYDAWLKSVNSQTTNFSNNVKIRKVTFNSPTIPKLTCPPGRETIRYPSLNSSGGNGVATKPMHGKVYTGTAMKGIGTLHKSNAVPIFTDEEARDQANMRR